MGYRSLIFSIFSFITYIGWSHQTDLDLRSLADSSLENIRNVFSNGRAFSGLLTNQDEENNTTNNNMQTSMFGAYKFMEGVGTDGLASLAALSDNLMKFGIRESLFYNQLIQQRLNTSRLIQNLPGLNTIDEIAGNTNQLAGSFISAVKELSPGTFKISTFDGHESVFKILNQTEFDGKILEITGPVGSTHVHHPGPEKFNSRAYSDSSISQIDDFLHQNSYPKMSYICQELKNWEDKFDPNKTELETYKGSIAFKLCSYGPLEKHEIDLIHEFFSSNYKTWNKGSLAGILGVPESALAYSHILLTLTYPPASMVITNPYSSQGAWPVPHANPYCNGASPYPAPDGSSELSVDTLYEPEDVSSSIFLFYTNNNKFLWGTSWFEVFKIDRTTNHMKIVDTVTSGDLDELMNDIYHGAYSVLTLEENLIVPRATRLSIFHDQPHTNGQKIMKSPFEYFISNDLPNYPTQYFIATVITHNGDVAWVTNKGLLGVNCRFPNEDFTHALDILDLKTIEEGSDDAEISNSIAADLEGGIYIVTSRYLHKINWDGKKLKAVWSTLYGLGIDMGSVRLGKGSGSTPSLMGPPENQYVVITDDSELMNVLAFDGSNGDFVASHPVTFGIENLTSSLSEQSLLVSGWRIGVVNNDPTNDPMTGFLNDSVLWSLGSLISIIAPSYTPYIDRFINLLKMIWPVLIGDAPKGIEQIQFDPFTKKFFTTWSNNISIPNGIPSMSSHSGLMYGIGKRGFLTIEAAPFRGMWTLEAVDWWYGHERFHTNLGMGPYSNSLYSATQIGVNEIVSGVIGGVVKVDHHARGTFNNLLDILPNI